MFEIEFPMSATTDIFGSTTISTSMTKQAPGGATIELRAMPMQKRHLPQEAEPLFRMAVSFGRDVAVGVFASWLYDKLKRAKTRHVRINRRTVEITPDGLYRALEQTIEIENK